MINNSCLSNLLGNYKTTPYSIAELGSIRSLLKHKYSLMSDTRITQLHYGYCVATPAMEVLEKLKIYIWAIETYMVNSKCLCRSEVTNLVENCLTFVGSASCDTNWVDSELIQDKSGMDKWIGVNPNSIPREKYELIAINYLGDLGFDVKVLSVVEVCKVFADISSEQLSDAIMAHITSYKYNCTLDPQLVISQSTKCDLEVDLDADDPILVCEVLSDVEVDELGCTYDVDLKVDTQNCDVPEINLNVTQDECNDIDFKILVDSTKCDLDITKFKSLINDCKVPLEFITEVYACGLTMDIDPVVSACPIVITETTAYNLCDTLFDLKKL